MRLESKSLFISSAMIAGFIFAAASSQAETAIYSEDFTAPWEGNTNTVNDRRDVVTFSGRGTAGTNIATGSLKVFDNFTTSPSNFTIILDTTAAAWTAEWLVNGNSERSEAFTTNPTINYVGLGRENGASTTFSNFSLTSVPEPSSAVLLGHGGSALRRRK